jgi:hypothetical protein
VSSCGGIIQRHKRETSYFFLFFAFVLSGRPLVVAQAQQAGRGRTIVLTLPEGTPIQIALAQEVRVRSRGQSLEGRVMQPVYVFDRMVVPVGTKAVGHLAEVLPLSGQTRVLHALDADFSPPHALQVSFDELIFADGRRVPLQANVVPGSGQTMHLSTAGEHQKQGVVKDAAAQKMDQVRAQWSAAMKQIREPGRTHRAVRYMEAQLPVHPQYIDAGTLYSAVLTKPLAFGDEFVPAQKLTSLGAQPPPGSLVHALLTTPLDSKITAKGANVEAVLSQPLIDNDLLILPAGTALRGTVLQSRPARYFHRNGQLRITFREVALPDGVTRVVDTSLLGITANSADNLQLDSEGAAKATSPKSRYLTTGLSLSLALVGSGGRDDVGDAAPAAGGATGFKLIGLIVGLTFRSHTYGILMSAYGGGRSIYNNFLSRGRNIVFPRNTNMEIGIGSRSTLPMSPGKP